MPRRTTRTNNQQTERDMFVGREYLCCRGPLKGQAITVAGKCPPSMGDRYYLEAEGGRKWNISGDKLRRIFGAAAVRTCGCTSLERTILSSEVSEVKTDSSTDDKDSRKVGTPATTVKEVAPPETIHPKEKSTQARLW